MRPEIDAVLMASGFSRRFGAAEKLLQPFAGRPLAWHTLALVCAEALFHEIFFVAAAPAVLALAEGYPVTAVRNRRPERGIRESIRLGVSASGAAGYMFFPCDQPLLDRGTLHLLLEKWDGGSIVFPAYRGRRGSPVLFPGDLRGELLTLEEGESGRTVMERHRPCLRAVELSDPAALMDVDEPGEIDRLYRHIE